MRPEEIRNLMQSLNRPNVAQTNPERSAEGDNPEAGAPSTVKPGQGTMIP